MSPEVEARINELAARNEGRITPDDVIADARKKASPLHSLFEWDKEKAALEHWRETARTIIRSVRVVIHTERTVVRAIGYVRDPEAGQHQGYVAVATLRTNREKAAEAVAYETKRAEAAMLRAREVAESLDLAPFIDEAIERIVDIRSRAAAA